MYAATRVYWTRLCLDILIHASLTPALYFCSLVFYMKLIFETTDRETDDIRQVHA